MRPRRPPALIALLATPVLAVITTGCPSPAPTGTVVPSADPEARSSADASRAAAVPIALGVAATDEVSFDRQDRTDWKKIELPPRPGVLSIELRWDNPEVELDCDVYNSLGQQIAASPHNVSEPLKRILVQVDSPAVHYVRIQAPRTGVSSVYSVLARYDDGSGSGNKGGTVTPVPRADADAGAPDAGVPADAAVVETPEKPEPTESDADEVQGLIVTAYLEGGYLTLQIDKGSAAGVKVGARGRVLDGAQGSESLPGSEFTITTVVDGSRSIGRTKLKTLPKKSRRVAIIVGK